MYYVSYGTPKNMSYELMDRIVSFACQFLEINESIEIDFEDEFEEGCCGYCEYEEEDKEVTVFVNPDQSVQNIITTIFHELVHAKQYIRGELVSGIGKQPSRWLGKECDANYFDTPWEQEAYELEAVMWDIFKAEKQKVKTCQTGV